MPDVQSLCRQCAYQRRQHVGTMHLIVREAECGLDRAGQWRAKQSPAVVPPALVPRERLYAELREGIGEPQPMQYAGSVGADLDARADLAQRPRPFVDVDIYSRAQQRQR